jgi:hypothetical protein
MMFPSRPAQPTFTSMKQNHTGMRMISRKRFWIGLLLLELGGVGGCDVQDSTQPAAGSISVRARKDDLSPGASPAKTKAAPDARR